MKLRLIESMDGFSGNIDVSKQQKDVHDTVKAVLKLQN